MFLHALCLYSTLFFSISKTFFRKKMNKIYSENRNYEYFLQLCQIDIQYLYFIILSILYIYCIWPIRLAEIEDGNEIFLSITKQK